MNFRIYWDGDLQDECFNNTEITKPGKGTLETLMGAFSNNGTKATPCFQGDVFGDWREEVIERTGSNNIRIYTTTTPTPWRNYSLWYDHQYRNAMSECRVKDTEIKYTYYTHTLTGGAFSGNMRLVKQGDGTLVLPNVIQTYTGKTDVWAGTLQFDGTMEKSPVWLNRFAELNSNGGNFKGGIKADYGSVIRPGGKDQVGTLTTSDLQLGFGARIVFDVNGENVDKLVADKMSIEKKKWENGPQYSAPVFEFTSAPILMAVISVQQRLPIRTVSNMVR